MIQPGGDESRPPDSTDVKIMGEMKKKRILVVVAAAVIVFVVFGFLLLWKAPGPEKVEKLRIGVSGDPVSALPYIAQAKGMFRSQGIEVSLENYAAGAYSVRDLLDGKVDVAAASEFVLALRSFKTLDLRTVSTISSTDSNEVIARRDRGISKPEDLRGKRVGVAKGTSAEFFLSTFLSFNNVLPSVLQMIDLKPPEMVTALTEGKIDAASCFPPFSDVMKRSLSHNALSWPAQGGRDYYFLLITREELLKTRSGAIAGLLRGVLDAETFLKKHEKEGQDIMQKTLNMDRDALMSTWSKTRFRVRLDQELLTLMEDEARWAIRNKLVEAETIPDYSTFLYLEGLKKIKPEAVGIN